MSIEHLEITHFRNLRKASLDPSPALNFIIGNNGSGKTSLLEAIYFLGTAKSFRTPHSKQAILFGESEFVVFAKIGSQGDVSIPMGIAKSQDSMTIKVANRAATSASVLANTLPVQLINPDVHKMLEEGPRFRRRFLEWGLFHVKPTYFQHWQECRQILKQRNAALKAGLPSREIEQWNVFLCEKTETITSFRQQYLEDLQPYVAAMLERCGPLPVVDIKLSRGWTKHKTLIEVLHENLASDRERGFTQYGPHRSDLTINCQGMRAKEVVSRGQQKMITALLKLAQIQMLNQLEQQPKAVLLVDDLPAELDHQFRGALLDRIAELNTQSFVTATDLSLLGKHSLLENSKMFHVEHGVVA